MVATAIDSPAIVEYDSVYIAHVMKKLIIEAKLAKLNFFCKMIGYHICICQLKF